MNLSFAILSRLTFLQDFASLIIAKFNPIVFHNLQKYNAIKKAFYLSSLEDTTGDYLEFGVFTGSSFCHSIRCCNSLAFVNPKLNQTKFFGFDSFQGFGSLPEDEKHPFFINSNFVTNFNQVNKRVSRVIPPNRFKLIPGFFSESLSHHPKYYEIDKPASVIFIDSDTYTSANEALEFCTPLIQNGTIFILDDFYAYKGDPNKGVCLAFNEFVEKNRFFARKIFSYGMGGVVYIVTIQY